MSEEFEVSLVCPERTLGLQIDGKKPPFCVKPVKLPSAGTEMKDGNILVGLDEWKFLPDTRISEVLDEIRKVMASDQPVIKLVLQRKSERPAGSTWECQRCTMVNTKIQSLCTTCGLEQAESMKRSKYDMPTDWMCPSYTYQNPSDQEKCGMFETAKSALGVKNKYTSGRKDMDEQLKIVVKRSLSNENASYPVENTYETEGKPNAPELLASQNWQNQHGMQMQYRQPNLAPNQQQSQLLPIQSCSQYSPPEPQTNQQNLNMQDFTQSNQQRLILAQEYKKDKMVPLQDQKSSPKEHQPEPEVVKSVQNLPLWKCRQCTASNVEEAVNCNTCCAPRMSKEVKIEDKLHPQTILISRHQAKKWKCPLCHHENKVSDARCHICSRSTSHMENYEDRSDPKEALETVDREKVALAWLQKQVVTENGCTEASFDAAFMRADHQVTEAIFRITSGFQSLDLFKGKLERFLGEQVDSLKRMGEQLEGRQQKLGDELEKCGRQCQEKTEFLNITQKEVDEKSYLKEYHAKLDRLIKQEKDLKHRLNEIKAQKDKVTLKMRSERLNKKLQLENCDTVVKQLKEHLGFFRTEKNELDVQVEMIRQQVNNYDEMRRSLENVKLNDLKLAVKTFPPTRNDQNYSQKKKDTSSLLEYKEVNDMVSIRSHQDSPQVQSRELSKQSTPEERQELPEHPEDFRKFFSGENMQIFDQGDTFDENSDRILFRK